MPEKKRQHFVSKFYLKNFSNASNGKSINIFNLKKEKVIYGASLRDQAYKDYFYGKDGVIENALAPLEGGASAIISDIIRNGKVPQRNSDKHTTLLVFTIFLHSRTKQAANQENEFVDKFAKQIFSKDSRVKDFINDYKVGLKDAPRQTLKHSAEAIPYALDLNFKFIRNETKTGFITSDNPVVFYNQFLETRKTYGSNIGLAVKGLEIFLPLSAKYAAIFFDEAVYRVGKETNVIISTTNTSDVYQLNCLQILSCDENVYFKEVVTSDYLLNAYRKVKKKRLTSVPVINEYPGSDTPQGEKRSLIHAYKRDIKNNLGLSFISITEQAKRYKLGNKVVHLRNEERAERIRVNQDFNEAVKKGKYTEDQFHLFVEDMLKRERDHGPARFYIGEEDLKK